MCDCACVLLVSVAPLLFYVITKTLFAHPSFFMCALCSDNLFVCNSVYMLLVGKTLSLGSDFAVQSNVYHSIPVLLPTDLRLQCYETNATAVIITVE